MDIKVEFTGMQRQKDIPPGPKERYILDVLGDSVEHYFFTKVAGTSHLNKDGSSRQEILQHCQSGEALAFEREPSNPVDPMAVALIRASGEQVGYLDARLAHETINRIESGEVWGAILTAVTGGTHDAPGRGANIIMVRFNKERAKARGFIK